MKTTRPNPEKLSSQRVETITLTSQEFRDMLGLQLPKTATNYRAFWANPKNVRRVQNLLGLSSGFTCKVEFRQRVVVFQKTKSAPD